MAEVGEKIPGAVAFAEVSACTKLTVSAPRLSDSCCFKR